MRYFLLQINDDGSALITALHGMVPVQQASHPAPMPVQQAPMPVQQAFGPSTHCRKCNAFLKFHHEGVMGFCGACGPGSSSWQAEHQEAPIGTQYIGPVGPQVHHGGSGGGSRMQIVNPGPGGMGAMGAPASAPGGGVPVIDNAAGRNPGVHPVPVPTMLIDNSQPTGAPVCAACKLEALGIGGVSQHAEECPRKPAGAESVPSMPVQQATS